MFKRPFFLLPLLASLLVLYCGMAQGRCSRSINVPVSVTGQSVTAAGDHVGGVYPEILRGLALKEDCNFVFSLVPRARLEMLFESGQADLLLPANRTARRDELGVFIPLIYNRATLVSLQSARPAVRSGRELLERRELRVTLVRGYDFGEGYQALVGELLKQGRVSLEADPVSVARLLKAGASDLTIMTPSILAGAILDDARVMDVTDKLRIEPIEELPWRDAGVYVSRKSLSAEDRQALQDMLERVARSGDIWKGFQRYYTPEVLKDSIRPRESQR